MCFVASEVHNKILSTSFLARQENPRPGYSTSTQPFSAGRLLFSEAISCVLSSASHYDMTNPPRRSGAARQWGVINNILILSSQASKRTQPSRRQARDVNERAHTDSEETRQQQSLRSPQHLSPSDQRNYDSQACQRSHSLKGSIASQSDSHCDKPQHREEQGRNKEAPSVRRSEQQRNRDHIQTRSSETTEMSRIHSKTINGAEAVEQPSSRKRKRTLPEGSSDAEHLGTVKRQRPNHLIQERLKYPLPRTSVEPNTVAPKSVTITATRAAKRRDHSLLPTSPSSNRTPEYDISSKHIPTTTVIFTPTPSRKSGSSQIVPRNIDVGPARSRKRRREDDVEVLEEPKRVRQISASEPTRFQEQPLSGPSPTPKQTYHDLRVPARVVRPESSFAPVAPNYTCELRFFDYLHDSVPILFSSTISHSPESDFLNSPSGTLVVNALAIIGPSVDSQAKRGWPSAVEIPGRTASSTNPVKVVSDVDLYLHGIGNELCVATERGLVDVPTYLELIGVPKRQPIRFEGFVPSWARAKFRNPEKRRIVWRETSNAGKTEIIPSHTVIGPHQLTLTLQTHAEVVEERAHIKAWEDQTKREPKTKPAHPLLQKISGSKMEAQERQPGPGEMKVLTAEPGQLPLRAGSVVLVYAIDNEDIWAYGRLSGTQVMGKLQIKFTCPLDWSLDRFAAIDNALDGPLDDSKDVSEGDWWGFYHWVRQAGYASGPTWEQTVEAGVTKARNNISGMLANRKSQERAEASTTAEVSAAQSEHAVHQLSSGDDQSPGLAATAQTVTMLSEPTFTSIAAHDVVIEASPVVLSLGLNGDTGSTRVEGDYVTRHLELQRNAHLESGPTEYVGATADCYHDQQQKVMEVDAVDQEARKVGRKGK